MDVDSSCPLDSKEIKKQNIKNEEKYILIKPKNPNKICHKDAGPIIKRFEEIYNENEFKDIINFSDIKKGDIYINLIHFDKNLKNEQNTEYYRYFTTNIIGSYYPFDDFDILKFFISKLKQIPFPPQYILMTSGNESENILKEFHDIAFINDIVIFCFEKDNYSHLKKSYKKIKLIENEFPKIVEFFKSQKFSKEDINMDNHLLLTPLITYYEYKKIIFPIHRILSYFFNYEYRFSFSEKYFLIAKKYIDESTLETDIKEKIISIMEKLKNTSDSEFPKKCIKYYTGENLCYVFNKALRNFEKFYVEMAHFIGPFYYGIYLYSWFNEKKQLNKKTILYRDITMERLDLYYYQFCENDIIVFPSFTSTTLDKNLNFEPTNNAKKINNNQIEEKSYVKMIITYDPKGNCEVQGLDISEESEVYGEKEILLFPFTFLIINKVEIHTGKENDKHLIFMTIINKGDNLEFGLKKNYGFKLVENGTKIVVDKENNSSFDGNESDYNMKFKYLL